MLSPEEVKRITSPWRPSLEGASDADPRLWFAGCGPARVVRLRASDIDSEQMIIRIVQSKGRKDRHVMLPAEVLELLRQWWKARLDRAAGRRRRAGTTHGCFPVAMSIGAL